MWTSWNRTEGVLPASARLRAYSKLAGCPSVNIPADRVEEIQARGYITGYAYNMVINSWHFAPKMVNGEFVLHDAPTTDSDFRYPASTVVFFDAELDAVTSHRPDPHEFSNPYPYGVERGWKRHNGGGNYLFCDNHVRWLHKEQVLPGEPRVNDGTQPAFALYTQAGSAGP